jgi:hypothetical protein
MSHGLNNQYAALRWCEGLHDEPKACYTPLMLCDNDDARYGLFPLFILSSLVFRQDRNQGRTFAPVSLQSRQNDRDQPVMLSLLSP